MSAAGGGGEGSPSKGAERLRRRREFQHVYDQGVRAHGRFMTLVLLPNQQNFNRLGVSATRKIGGAVGRNRAKRRVRELFRRTLIPPGFDMVVVVRRELIDAPWQELMDEFSALIARPRRSRGRRRDG